MQLLRESSYAATPWKNGGGITREIHRSPAGPVEFDWRLSLASIDRPGPFSAFPGYQRSLVLVRGAGVELDFGEHGACRLERTGQCASFDGSWPAECRLIDGPSTDLNLIVSALRAEAEVQCVKAAPAMRIETAGWTETFVCVLDGAVELTNATGETGWLKRIDVARCCESDGPLTCRAGADAAAHLFIGSVRHRPPR